jgi:hypothetical protein
MFLGGSFILGDLHPPVQVKKNPPISGWCALKGANKKRITMGGGRPVNPIQGVARDILPHSSHNDGALQGICSRTAFTSPSTRRYFDGR